MTALAPGRSPARRGALLFALALACGAAPAAADYRESYRKGIEEADRKAWGAVATYMRQAAAEQGKEGEAVKIYGVRYVPYLPHFYLGLALSKTGACQEALEQWKESERQGAVQGTAQYRALQHGREVCLETAGKPPAPPPDKAATTERPARDEEARKEAALTEAARSDAARNEAARNEAARSRAARETTARNDAAAKDAARNEAARRDAAAKEAARVEAARVEATRNEAARNEAARNEAARTEAASAAADRPGPPPELRAAARALFRADYEGVVRTLRGASFAERRAKLTAAVLLGAARYALYVQGGAKDDRLRRQALDDARACRRLDPAFRPDAGFFSPGFRELYRTAG